MPGWAPRVALEVWGAPWGSPGRSECCYFVGFRWFSEMSCFLEIFENIWEPATQRQSGSIFFTGATASLRGSSGFSAFASAKFALRALSQSIARELGPQGIHVAHIIIDGAIDTAFIKENFPERYALKEKDGILSPEKIADSYWFVHSQHRSAWTHELDLRPYMETF